MNRRIIILSLVLFLSIVLVTVTVQIIKNENRPKGEPEEDQIVVFQTQDTDVKRVSVENKSDSYSFIKSDSGQFVPENASDISIASGKYDDLFINAFKIYAVALVEENTNDMDKYGFSDPQAKLTLQMENGETREFIIGNSNILKTSYFLYDVKLQNVYTISKYRGEIFMRKLADLREDPLPKETYDVVERFELYTPGKKNVKVSIDLSNPDAKWVMEEPYNRDVNAGSIRTMMTENIVKITADDIAASQVKDLSQYGLKTPSHTLVFKIKDKTPVTLNFGNTDGTKVYFNINGGNIVYRFDKDILNIFDTDPINLTDRLGYIANLTDVSSLMIQAAGKTYEINTDSDNNQYEINGKAIEESSFKKLYRTLMSFIITEDVGKNTPGETIYSMKVVKKDSSDDLIEVKKVDDRRCLLLVNGKGDFLISRSDVDTMVAELNGI